MNKNFEIPGKNSKYHSKYLGKFCPAVGNTGVFSAATNCVFVLVSFFGIWKIILCFPP